MTTVLRFVWQLLVYACVAVAGVIVAIIAWPMIQRGLGLDA